MESYSIFILYFVGWANGHDSKHSAISIQLSAYELWVSAIAFVGWANGHDI